MYVECLYVLFSWFGIVFCFLCFCIFPDIYYIKCINFIKSVNRSFIDESINEKVENVWLSIACSYVFKTKWNHIKNRQYTVITSTLNFCSRYIKELASSSFASSYNNSYIIYKKFWENKPDDYFEQIILTSTKDQHVDKKKYINIFQYVYKYNNSI